MPKSKVTGRWRNIVRMVELVLSNPEFGGCEQGCGVKELGGLE
jgi:hypothetical protein